MALNFENMIASLGRASQLETQVPESRQTTNGSKKRQPRQKRESGAPARKRAESSKVKLQQKDTISRERLQLQRNASEEHILNRVQETVTHYGPNGCKVSEMTTTRHEEKSNKQEALQMAWTREKIEREKIFEKIDRYSLEECKQMSHGFRFYEHKIRSEIMIFKQKVKLYLDNDIQRAWTDTSFVTRFLFGIPNEWEQAAQLAIGEIPWLACLWTMKEMLDLCNDPTWVSEFCEHPWNSFFYKNLDLPNTLFCINQQMMCGFVTGQLLAHTMPELDTLFRDHVRQEVTSLHFPTFHEYILDNNGPPMLLLNYDFRNVDYDIPAFNARDCDLSNTCCVFGLEPDDRKHVFCDALFVRLLAHKPIRDAATQSARDIGRMSPKSKNQRDIDDFFEVVDCI